jgi:hypothetical protein
MQDLLSRLLFSGIESETEERDDQMVTLDARGLSLESLQPIDEDNGFLSDTSTIVNFDEPEGEDISSRKKESSGVIAR